MEEPSLEALMQAGLIFVVGVAIILSNLLIIATYLNFRGNVYLFNLLTEIKIVEKKLSIQVLPCVAYK